MDHPRTQFIFGDYPPTMWGEQANEANIGAFLSAGPASRQSYQNELRTQARSYLQNPLIAKQNSSVWQTETQPIIKVVGQFE
jgi:hypothetical protein